MQAKNLQQVVKLGYYEDKWIGQNAKGFMFYLDDDLVLQNFTDFYMDKLMTNSGKMFHIPIGHRGSSLKDLPKSFPAIPASCILPRKGQATHCCVGYGFAAAMHASGDREWEHIRDLAVTSVLAAEDADGELTNEIGFYKKHVNNHLQRTYKMHKFTSGSFHPEMMQKHDIAVCQVSNGNLNS